MILQKIDLYTIYLFKFIYTSVYYNLVDMFCESCLELFRTNITVWQEIIFHMFIKLTN